MRTDLNLLHKIPFLPNYLVKQKRHVWEVHSTQRKNSKIKSAIDEDFVLKFSKQFPHICLGDETAVSESFKQMQKLLKFVFICKEI